MNLQNYEEVTAVLRREPENWRDIAEQKEVLVVGLNRKCDGMIEDAVLLRPSAESVHALIQTVDPHDYRVDHLSTKVEISLEENGDPLVAFVETRPKAKPQDAEPNGINVVEEELEHAYVIFLNAGDDRLTVNGDWLEPSEYHLIREADINSPEVRQGMEAFLNSPRVKREIDEAMEESKTRLGK